MRARSLAVGGDGGADMEGSCGVGLEGLGGSELERMEGCGLAIGDEGESLDGLGGELGRLENEVGGGVFGSISLEPKMPGRAGACIPLTVDPFDLGLMHGEVGKRVCSDIFVGEVV